MTEPGIRYVPCAKRYPYREDANGNRICAVCGKPCTGKYCAKECRLKAWIECVPSEARRQVRKRDGGVCARCGWDTGLIERALRHLHNWRWMDDDAAVRDDLLGASALLRKLLGLGFRGHFWEAHHKVAVADGGGLCGLDGYETLCVRCHGKESGHQRKERRARKESTLFEAQP